MRSVIQRCPHCGTQIGRLVEKGNVIYFDTGDSMIEKGYKHCHACGYKFSYMPPKIGFDKFVEKAKSERGGLVIN